MDVNTVIWVQPDNPLDVKPEALQGLVEGIHELGQDARVAYHDPKEGTFRVTWWEVVTIWVGAEVGKTSINQIVELAAAWAKERFRLNPDNRRPKALRIAQSNGKEGHIEEVVELRSERDEPVRKTPEAFETYTRRKPPIR